MEKRALFIILLVKALLMVALIQYGRIPLGPDEAQYWTWSRQLDWGYYSKPPGIAWEIWAGTMLFGSTELGVRFGAVVLAFFLGLATYRLAKQSGLQKSTAMWAAIILAFSPMGVLASFLATTDCGYVLFWTLGCSLLARAIHLGKAPNYLMLGLIVAVGALFKWPIYYLWAVSLVCLLFYPRFRNPQILLGMALSLAGLLPSVLWNYEHDWSTFRHVWGTIAASKGTDYHAPSGNPLEFFGAQAALASPILFVMMGLASFSVVKNWKQAPSAIKFLAGVTVSIYALFQILAFFQKIQGNWAILAYPTGFVLVSWYACEFTAKGKFWMRIGNKLSIALVALILLIPLPYKVNPFRHNIGWRELPKALTKEGYQPEKDFLFSDNYQMTSILSFYSPGQKQAYFLNIGGRRKNQYSYWPSMAGSEAGKTGYTVIAGPRLTESQIDKHIKGLSPYFSKVTSSSVYTLFKIDQEAEKVAMILKGIHYNGEQPADLEIY